MKQQQQKQEKQEEGIPPIKCKIKHVNKEK